MIKAALGTAEKEELAQLVFKNATKRKQLEKILHPRVLKEVQARIRQSTRKLIVAEVPLLFEAGWQDWMDFTLCVCADPATLNARLKGRNMSRREYAQRLKTQLPAAEKAAKADIVFVHKNKMQLKQSVMQFCRAFNVLQNK